MAFLDDLKNYLEGKNIVGGSTGWEISLSYLPPNPDKVIVLYETPGDPAEITKSSDETAYDFPGFQVRGRSSAFDYAALKTKMQEIFQALHQNEPVAGSGEKSFVYIYSLNSTLLPLGLDSNDRPGATWNFRTMRERGE